MGWPVAPDHGASSAPFSPASPSVTLSRPREAPTATRGSPYSNARSRTCARAISGSVHDPTDPVGRLLFNVLGIAEFESDVIRMRTREGMNVAEAESRLRGKQPKLKPAQKAHLVDLWRAGKHTRAELAELFSVARRTVYRAVQRAREPKTVWARKA